MGRLRSMAGIDSATSHWHDSAMPDDARYSLTELADLAGVTPRTVRYYLAQRPAAGRRARPDRAPSTATEHLGRLRLIRRLQREHLPLAEIRQRLDGPRRRRRSAASPTADDTPPPADSALDYLRTVLGDRRGPATARRPPAVLRPPDERARAARWRPASMPGLAIAEPAGDARPARRPPPVERSQWERIVLAPDVELHVRRPLSRTQNKRVDRLVTIARELLEEDRP